MTMAIEPRIEARSNLGTSSETTILNDPVLPRIAAGETAAVQDCLDRYGALVWSIAKRMSANHADAEDAVQEVFIVLWRMAAQFNPSLGSESTFIAMITRRRLIDRMRRSKSKGLFPSLEQQAIEPIAREMADPMEQQDEVQKAMSCFRKLTESAQRVLQLSIHEGVSYTQIAGELHMPIGSVKSFARRGLLQLRECMKRPNATIGKEPL